MSSSTHPPSLPPPDNIEPVAIEEEMKRSYLDYAMSVIVSRALPDVRDGLKPVHRRILYSMHENNYDWTKPYRKSARVVGDVIGKYHPHGETAIYDAMVRMAQLFSMRLPLIDGQGNYGSIDGDPPAAMRYTEARLSKPAGELLASIEKQTVDFQTNYDDSLQEPKVLPAGFPNLLVNGAGGIAVGMATNIPTHNLGEVIESCLAYIENPDISIAELMQYIKGPDFPTGALILGQQGILDAYRTGRGSIIMRARTEIEEIRRDREAIIVTEIPYQVNKSRLLERIAELVQEKSIEGISDLRDESDRHGMRIVIEIKRDASSEIILNQLYRFTALQSSFSVNMLALNQGRPELLTLKQVIAAFIQFREEVIRRRTLHELNKARSRAHLVIGLLVAVVNIDAVIALIRSASDPVSARFALMARSWPSDIVAPLIRLAEIPEDQTENQKDGSIEETEISLPDSILNYSLSEAQARAILDLRLQRLTGLEREKLDSELNELVVQIAGFVAILGSRKRLYEIMCAELTTIKDAYATPRFTEIQNAAIETDIEDLIQREEMVVTITHGGYIKRTPLSTYRAQRRGGKGRSGMVMRDEDLVSQLFVASTHTPMLFFTSRGIVYKLKVYRLPLGNPQARGKALINLLPIQQGETVNAVLALPENEQEWSKLDVMFATSRGAVRRNSLHDFVNVKANGKIAMKLEDETGQTLGQLIGVATCTHEQDTLLVTRKGKCIRFSVAEVRLFSSRNSTGVRGIRLGKEDQVISMSILNRLDASVEEREAYLKYSSARRRQLHEAEPSDSSTNNLNKEVVPVDVEPQLSHARITEMEEAEEFIISVTENGFGKRSSSYEYRRAGRGGKGIDNVAITERNGSVVAAFPVLKIDDLILVTDAGQLLRCPVADIRIAGRVTQGVTLLRVAEGERVVSVSRLVEDSEEGDDDQSVTNMLPETE